ncbi:MAG: peptide deformylase [Candidatus Wildermuthbacteria bacterium RIFCSPLOWO2_01_FULL_48_16]|uniref:Peptide deformylase n=1 Tax=Candidatus Wildermuthbacteria bacterium RIFCSPLOWO2_01_FULL_48_16 TaxID=1802461 RepID=A0A1G2RKL6_9BACT|nr:MAG: peptide deformylase [Candidatus Wildermuthbacteria bacterium RIFCSPHIGHO2_02_FULL_49_12b]OHA73394.1 MAG: peptide deformylase [Candidatus Wildermuthbacteria bacterium RIFCSPLOWO2_01_FULL_48_16]
MNIVKYPSPILKKKAKNIKEITKEHVQRIPEMIRTMDANEGIGLAAPQVGISERMIIVKDGEQNLAFFNPRILKKGKAQETEEEGCLSLPGLFTKLRRASQVEVVAQDAKGKPVYVTAKGLSARILQHEIDHLEGKLIINRVSPIARLKLRKQLKAIAKTGSYGHKPPATPQSSS